MNAKHEKPLRADLAALLTAGNAHASFDSALKNLPADLRGQRPPSAPHSPWELLEHLRIAQWDIIEYTLNPKHKSPDWPSGYWPKSPKPPNRKAWDKSIFEFRADQKKLIAAIKNPSTDLLAPIPHANNASLLTKTLLLADHNAYHIGQLILTRRLLNAWHG